MDNNELLIEIRKLREDIKNLEKNQSETNLVLRNHISFIESVFDKLKKPLFFVMDKVNYLMNPGQIQDAPLEAIDLV